MGGGNTISIRAVLFIIVAAWMSVLAVAEQPTPTGLEEKVEKRLVQFDVAGEIVAEQRRTLMVGTGP